MDDLRATFEARGYTTCDPTSPAFARNRTLFIQSLFCLYGREALDVKIPLLRSSEALTEAAFGFLRFFPRVRASRGVSCG
jgi:glutamine synthetase